MRSLPSTMMSSSSSRIQPRSLPTRSSATRQARSFARIFATSIPRSWPSIWRGLAGSYFVRLKKVLTREVDIFVPYQTALETLSLGATGLLGAEANIVPETFRAYIDYYRSGDFMAAAKIYSKLQQLTTT